MNAQEKLADAFSLLDLSERLLEDIENAPLSELPRIVSLLRKNLRDAKKLVSDAEVELDGMIKKIDEHENYGIIM